MRKFKNRKKLNVISIFLILDLLVIFAIFKISNASYYSEAIGSATMRVALYAFRYDGMHAVDNLDSNINNTESTSIELGKLLPGDVKYYKFRVYNTDMNGAVADTDISYELKISTTTNIDLDYELYINQSPFSSKANNIIQFDDEDDVIETDEYGTYFRTFAIPEKCFKYGSEKYDEYTLKVTFPNEYNNISYQDLIESIKIQLTSKQVLPGDVVNYNNVCR